jgi:hypothetical protein
VRKRIPLFGSYVPTGKYTIDAPLVFKTERAERFGGATVPAGVECRFFDVRKWGWLVWRDPLDKKLRCFVE